MNTEENYGTILDENFQDIYFSLINLPLEAYIYAKVSFEIQLLLKGLEATNICLL
ncbi:MULTISPECIES: hypothetical protein [unclassified Pedobacter]|jgi:hypothetical protein|uniref:hypothetical protein n=1 Tax=unclassified Pedobacter TaxID=2628915 RepID=UPI002248310E|nr:MULTISPECIES: hypothetical protein [unclassified Pedobacter]MCX2430711.1 hypothetical protein [Pedobacter sp. GR22-10]MCX2584088.1 hypothetical protein [Pedobacter sp. MR22-3]